MRADGFVERQRQVRQYLADEEIRAGVAGDQVRVFPDPAEARLARERALEHGSGIHEHAISHRADVCLDVVGQALQRAAQDLVIVAAQRVARDVRGFRVRERVASRPGIRWPIVHARGQDPHGARHQLFGARALRAVFVHVVHLAVAAGVDPAIEIARVDVKRHIGDAESLEAPRPRELDEPRPELLRRWLGRRLGRRWIGKVHGERPV
jgi:hypothetical protein